eukprot:gene32454-42044_t
MISNNGAGILFPISQLPMRESVINDMTLGHFGSSMQYLAKGSNSSVYRAKYNNADVVVKIPKENSRNSLQDLRTERTMLIRISHPNIINIIGTGESPNEFISLEFLGGGTLKSLLYDKPRIFQLMEAAVALFTVDTNDKLKQILLMARDIASALYYLHDRFHPDACIIHRDLKPDNVGFTDNMQLKLFDFGLMTCVKRPTLATDMYQMSGCTGSPRYMAPEVAQRKPYNHKVDVYSFGILFWEMLTGTRPFDGFNMEDFMREVVNRNCRPKIPETLSAELSNLLSACWTKDPAARPSFENILTTLDGVVLAILESSVAARSDKPVEKILRRGDRLRGGVDTSFKILSYSLKDYLFLLVPLILLSLLFQLFVGNGSLRESLPQTNSSYLSYLPILYSLLYHGSSWSNWNLRDILRTAKEIAWALRYLYEDLHEDACIIYRAEQHWYYLRHGAQVFQKLDDSNALFLLTSFTGTLLYMAPEVAERKQYNHKVDVYSFGILLWEMLTGTRPFKDFVEDGVHTDRRPEIPWSLSTKLSGLLRDCWARDPATRPSFTAIYDKLEKVLHHCCI